MNSRKTRKRKAHNQNSKSNIEKCKKEVLRQKCVPSLLLIGAQGNWDLRERLRGEGGGIKLITLYEAFFPSCMRRKIAGGHTRDAFEQLKQS